MVSVRSSPQRLFTLALLALVTLALTGLGGSWQSAPAGAQVPPPGGQWSNPIGWPTTGIHSSVLPDGRVLHYAYPFQAPFASIGWLWNPQTGAFQSAPATYNTFCGGHALLPDGTVVNLGGTDEDSPEVGNPWGHKQIRLFNYSTSSFTYVGDTQKGRWYPTLTTLPSGKILISSGFDEVGELNNRLEIYDPASGSQYMPASSNIYLPMYPWMHVLPNGKLFDAGPQDISLQLDLNTNMWSGVAYNNYGARYDGTSVMLPLKAPNYRPEVMQIGGDNPATNTTERIDLGAAIPTYTYAAPMHHARHHANAVLLPDGTVGVFGGTALDNEPAQAVYAAEIYNPDADTWTQMASGRRPRIYHSTAILLPDGRILSSGTDGEFTSELYSPPYLFAGPRPTVSAAPAAVTHGANFLVTTPEAEDIEKVMLIKPAAATHSVNMEQRAIQLDFEEGANALSIDAPPTGGVAPPGYYMLFLVSSDGVPSIAKFVRIGQTNDEDGDGLTGAAEVSVHGTDPMLADSDNDSLSDGAEVLTHGTNPLTTDFDQDALSDGEEVNVHLTNPVAADTDADLLKDGVEVACDSVPTNVTLRPERLDGAFAGADDDGDLSVDEPLPGAAAGLDCDGDGFPGTSEDHVFAPNTSGDQDSCGGNGWLLDLNEGVGSWNGVTLADIGAFYAPVFHFNTYVGTIPGDQRWDIVPGSVAGPHINLQDVGALLAGATAAPPMLSGAAAFNGPGCPWPP
jgi:hypothetical protein